jgi:hypothetical protein
MHTRLLILQSVVVRLPAALVAAGEIHNGPSGGFHVMAPRLCGSPHVQKNATITKTARRKARIAFSRHWEND